jgi:DNA repair exonuclease SbcCD nuclease subunit
MKILFYADPHWSTNSSIVQSRGKKYSTRLENLIDSINWVEQQAIIYNCNTIVCLGDFFDKAQLSAEEITALQEISWADLSHVYLTGNHEMGLANLEYSTAHLFNLCPRTTVIEKPISYIIEDVELCFLPYILENNRKPLKEYFDTSNAYRRIIASHNDISGIELGGFITKDGFSIDEIESNCSLFLNGHLHNGSKVTQKIINVGNITGQNFSENAFIYSHNIVILDTKTMQLTRVENPFAFNFYKLENIDSLQKIKSNAVLSVKTTTENIPITRNILDENKNVLTYRLMSFNTTRDNNTINQLYFTDPIDKFKNFVMDSFGEDPYILYELEKLSR